MKYKVFLSLGSNIDREESLSRALKLLAGFVEIRSISKVFESDPVGLEPGAGPFFNVAALVTTDLEPEDLKNRIRKDVEHALGRSSTDRGTWNSRTIDVDISLWGDLVGEILNSPVPDPDILIRAHVAFPLADLAPEHRHPLTGQTLKEIAENLNTGEPIPRIRPEIILS